MPLPTRYTLVYVDQDTEATFTLDQAPGRTIVRGNITPPEAVELLEAIADSHSCTPAVAR